MWIILHLLFLSVEDLRYGEISMWVILNLGISGLFYSLAVGQKITIWPGMLLLLFSFLSREAIGYGDSWLILALGMWISWTGLLRILFWGIAIGAAGGLCLGRKEMPLLPFLSVAYLIGECV